MRPNDRGFWRRGTVIPAMGFGTFQDIDSFLYPRDFSEREHVSDAALTRGILAELDSANGPAFVTAVTMDNHGPWGDFAPALMMLSSACPRNLSAKAAPSWRTIWCAPSMRTRLTGFCWMR